MFRKNQIKTHLLNIFLLAIALALIYPFLMMVAGSFKSGTELSRNPAGLPIKPILENYVTLFTYNGGLMIRSFFNGIYISFVYIITTIAITSIAAFAFSKYKFKGRNAFFLLLISTIMVPRDVLLPPLFIMFSKVGLLDTYAVQILPFVANVFALFMLRQFMVNIPDSVLDSARIDGAGHLKIFLHLVFPMSAPAIGALSILLFNQKWNDFLWPVIMVNNVRKIPITVILPTITDASGDNQLVPWELILAGCTVITIPLLVFFFTFQDKVMRSMTAGAVKE